VVPSLPAGGCFGPSPGLPLALAQNEPPNRDTPLIPPLYSDCAPVAPCAKYSAIQKNGPHTTTGVDEENNGHYIYMKYCMGLSIPRRTLMDVNNKIKAERKKNKNKNDSTLSIEFTYTRLGSLTAEC